MKNKLFVLAAFAIALSSCSKESETLVDSTPISKDNTAVTTQQPVLFGAYVNRAVTRAGAEGVLTTNGTGVGQVSLESEGFGVFAYYTDDDLLCITRRCLNQLLRIGLMPPCAIGQMSSALTLQVKVLTA